MSTEAFRVLRSRALLLLRDDVDTDQIIPARFLTTTERAGLGRFAFADWRIDSSGTPRADFPLNAANAAGAKILVTGRNFGCGSSREHAPWALMDWGFRAVVAESFGDIFRNNAHKNGLLTVVLGSGAHRHLVETIGSQPDVELTIDLLAQTLQAGDAVSESFEMDRFVRYCLTEGIDELEYLLAAEGEIVAWERGAPAFASTDGGTARASGARL